MKLKLLILTLLIGFTGFSQKKEKIKGNKLVKVQQHQIAPFTTLNLNEDIEVYLLKGLTPQIEFETDENLHAIFRFAVDNNGTLNITTTHKITSKKELKIRITFTDEFTTIIASDKAKVNSLMDFDMKTLNINAKDNAKVYITAKTTDFKLEISNHAKIELNLEAQKAIVLMNESSNIKALINADNLKFDLYQKANAKIEGDVNELNLRADNATNFKGEKLTAKKCTLIAEGSSDCYIEVKNELTLEASGTTEVYIYGNPKIALNKFENSAVIYKK